MVRKPPPGRVAAFFALAYAAVFKVLTLCRVSCKVRGEQCAFEVIDLPEEL